MQAWCAYDMQRPGVPRMQSKREAEKLQEALQRREKSAQDERLHPSFCNVVHVPASGLGNVVLVAAAPTHELQLHVAAAAATTAPFG